MTKTMASHDANGNRTSKTIGTNVTSYTYDSLNRLTQVAATGRTIQYLYNGLGQRIGKIDNGVQTNYLIDPNGILPQVLAETDASNNLIAFYVYDGAGLVAKITPSNEYYFYHYDGLGSTIAITDSSAQVINSYAYSPEGLVGAQETIPNPFTYVGRFGVMAEGNGLYFMRARYYDPEVGRFINKDPIGYAGGMNLYGYVGNNPINIVDPWGLKEFKLVIRQGGGVGYYIIGGGVFDVTITDVQTGERTMYRMEVFGAGVGYPEINITSNPIIFSVSDPCMTSADFEGYGYIGGVSVIAGIGFTGGGGIKIPHGPFIPGEYLDVNYGGFRIGISHSITHFSKGVRY